MNNVCNFWFLLFLSTLNSCQSTPPDYFEIAIELNDEMETAFNEGNMNKLAAIYADNGYLLSKNRPAIHGRKAIDAYWQKWHTPINWTLDVIDVSQKEQDIYEHEYWENKNTKPKHWKEEEIEIGDANVFYQIGHSKIDYESDDGVHRTNEIDFIIVWIKGGDGYYYILVDTYV